MLGIREKERGSLRRELQSERDREGENREKREEKRKCV